MSRLLVLLLGIFCVFYAQAAEPIIRYVYADSLNVRDAPVSGAIVAKLK